MRPRLVDAALVVGLVLVAAAIVWTLFSLGRDPAPDRAPDAGPTAEAPPPDGGPDDVVPVAPAGDGADEEPGTAAGGEDAADAEGDDAAGEAAADADAADEPDEGPAPADAEAEEPDADADVGGDGGVEGPDPDVPAAQAPPLPDGGPVELGRIGFSYVTGGAGACGVVLEPWTHVAVSRELLEAYGCGAEVEITLDDETAGRTTFDAVVGDTMNPAFSRTVNVYVGEDEPALEFGLTAGSLRPQD